LRYKDFTRIVVRLLHEGKTRRTVRNDEEEGVIASGTKQPQGRTSQEMSKEEKFLMTGIRKKIVSLR